MEVHPFHRILRLAWGSLIVLTVPLLLSSLPLDNGKGDPGQGYWGEKTATVNFCEADYVVTPYIAEFGNSVSSVVISLIGLWGMYKHYKFMERRYSLALTVLMVIGAGSTMFHATLVRSMQLMDELPMVWMSCIFVYMLITLEDPKGKIRTMERFAVAAMAMLMTVAVVLFDTDNQDVFILCLISPIPYIAYTAWNFDKKYNSQRTLVLADAAIFFYLGGLFCWLTDRVYCSHVQSLHLHSLWHFGAGLGTYTLILCWMWTRLEFFKMKPTVEGYVPLQFIHPMDKVV